MALQESAEAYLVSLFEDTNLAVSVLFFPLVSFSIIHAWLLVNNSILITTFIVLVITGHPRQACHHPAQGYPARSTTQGRAISAFLSVILLCSALLHSFSCSAAWLSTPRNHHCLPAHSPSSWAMNPCLTIPPGRRRHSSNWFCFLSLFSSRSSIR